MLNLPIAPVAHWITRKGRFVLFMLASSAVIAVD
jgi:hypothetical protein